MNWPTLQEVREANVEQLLCWNRFLPLSETHEQAEKIGEITKRANKLREEDPAAYTAASKRIGWD